MDQPLSSKINIPSPTLYIFKNILSCVQNGIFFATSHGKGAVDAVGGKVKHSVWLPVKSRKHVVNNLF